MSAFEMENGLTVIAFDGSSQNGFLGDVVSLRQERFATVLVHGGKDVEDALEINERIVSDLGEGQAVSLALPLVVKASTSGDITSVDTRSVMTQLAEGSIPVIPPLAREQEGTRIFTSNADTVAGAVASGLQAARLVFATNARGVRGHCQRVLQELRPGPFYDSLRQDDMVRGDMIPKVDAGFKAAGVGVDVTICSFTDVARAVRGQSRVGTKLKAV